MLNTLNYSVCGKTLTIDHAITSQHGSLTSVDLRDITAELLSTVCNNVTIHPPLQPLSGEFLLLDQLTDKMMPESTFMVVVFMDGGKVPFLIYRFSVVSFYIRIISH